MTSDPTLSHAEAVEATALRLLDAMDRQYGSLSFSANVQQARDELRALLPASRDPLDKADRGNSESDR